MGGGRRIDCPEDTGVERGCRMGGGVGEVYELRRGACGSQNPSCGDPSRHIDSKRGKSTRRKEEEVS